MGQEQDSGLTAERLRERLHYNPETGIFTWRQRNCSRGPDRTGQIAGTRSKKYIVICVDWVYYPANRLAWLYVHGRWPDGYLDHWDLDGTNNRIKNLRPATMSQNLCNIERHRDNTSGLKGVSRHQNKWRARISIDQRYVHLGCFCTAEEAHASYAAAARQYHGEFARVG